MEVIYFDMDGTLFDLYSVPDWLERLRQEDEEPYLQAAPMLNFRELSIILRKLQGKGVKIGIISWLAKESSVEYKKKVRQAKRKALKKIWVKFDHIHLVQYGTRKERVGNRKRKILFDDDDRVLKNWVGKNRVAIDVKEKDIMEELEKILESF